MSSFTDEYSSDLSDYEYESDGAEECISDSAEEYTSDTIAPKHRVFSCYHNIPKNTMQYAWTVMCLKLAEWYGEQCKYDYLTNNLCITFTENDKSFEMIVKKTKNKDEWFPYQPPHIQYKGKQISIQAILLITMNEIMSKRQWNICADLFSFVDDVLNLLKSETLELSNFSNEVVEINEAIINIAKSLSLTFAFKDNTLPALGVLEKKKSSTQYIDYDTNISLNTASLPQNIGPSISTILKLAKNVEINQYTTILQLIVSRIAEAKASSLDLCINDAFYRDVIAINEVFCLRVDISNISNCDTSDCEDDSKLQFIERFNYHSYCNETSAFTPKFMKRVLSEVDTVRESIKDIETYVLVSEQNVQQWKFLMIPDKTTPYHGGYFEFDMFIPNSYPNNPPKVTFLTTDNGKVRFNPNLYANGKVCLSLLNTWATNQWCSSSTLSQVILSIYSMIFNEHPYTNEPGYYDSLNCENGINMSVRYNEKIRRNCVQVAIRNQLQNTITPFHESIQTHWRKHRVDVIEHYRNFQLSIE